MKHGRESIYMTLVAAGALFAWSAMSEDKPAGSKAKDAGLSPEEMMKKAEAAGQPGPAHKALDALVGDWNVDARCWMAPDGPPTENKGTAKVRWILGNRFVQEDFSGEFMGKPFHGIALTGYDNMKKKYVGSWVDDMGTGMFISEGTADTDGKGFTFQGKMDDPMTGQMNKPIKFVIRILDPDKHTFEMHDLTLGEKTKTMEMTYTRSAAGRTSAAK
jgi:uncharacterized protein DUF1579